MGINVSNILRNTNPYKWPKFLDAIKILYDSSKKSKKKINLLRNIKNNL